MSLTAGGRGGEGEYIVCVWATTGEGEVEWNPTFFFLFLIFSILFIIFYIFNNEKERRNLFCGAITLW